MDKKHRKLVTAAGLAIGGLAIGAATVAAQSSAGQVEDADDTNEGPDIPITGPDLDRASAAALEFTGEGRVTATEIEDEESYYEVEVTLDDGSEIDVQLDEEFNVVGTD
jgi:uncharacterized membrane protein YkoI